MGIDAVAHTAAAAAAATAVSTLATIAAFAGCTCAIEFVDVGARSSAGTTRAGCTARAGSATMAAVATVARHEDVAGHHGVGRRCVGPRNKEGKASATASTASSLGPSAAAATTATAACPHVVVSRKAIASPCFDAAGRTSAATTASVRTLSARIALAGGPVVRDYGSVIIRAPCPHRAHGTRGTVGPRKTVFGSRGGL